MFQPNADAGRGHFQRQHSMPLLDQKAPNLLAFGLPQQGMQSMPPHIQTRGISGPHNPHTGGVPNQNSAMGLTLQQPSSNPHLCTVPMQQQNAPMGAYPLGIARAGSMHIAPTQSLGALPAGPPLAPMQFGQQGPMSKPLPATNGYALQQQRGNVQAPVGGGMQFAQNGMDGGGSVLGTPMMLPSKQEVGVEGSDMNALNTDFTLFLAEILNPGDSMDSDMLQAPPQGNFGPLRPFTSLATSDPAMWPGLDTMMLFPPAEDERRNSEESIGLSMATRTTTTHTSAPVPPAPPLFGAPDRQPPPMTFSQPLPPLPINRINPPPGMRYPSSQPVENETEFKRSAHIMSEQKRRDNIKDAFSALRNTLPNVRPGTTRLAVLKKATDQMEMLKKQNRMLRERVEALERGQAGQGMGTLDVLVEAMQKQLHITAKDKDAMRLLYKDEDLAVDITCQEDLNDLLSKYDATNEDIKLTVYVKRSHLQSVAMNPQLTPQAVATPETTFTYMSSPEPSATPKVELNDVGEPVADENDLADEVLVQGDDGVDLEDGASAMHTLETRHEAESSQQVSELYLAMQANPLMALGGPRMQQVEWQRARVYRFLKACNGNMSNAQLMLERHLEWLSKFKADQLDESHVARELATGKMYWHGHDKLGNPCLVFHVRMHDVEKRDKYETIRMWIYMFQQFLNQRADHPYRQFVMIYNRTGASKKNSDVAMLKKLVQMYQLNYPDICARIYVLQPDFVFKYAYVLLKKVTTKRFRAGIKLVSQKHQKETLLNYFDPENLPIEFGGTSVGSN